MIQINHKNNTYKCPFCGHFQAYSGSYDHIQNGKYKNTFPVLEEYQESSFDIYSLKCSNELCGRISVTAINRTSGKQIDLVPKVVLREYPDYIPKQIRDDYTEANLIIDDSPKAAATLLRRCLQGMIHDFWGIREKNLNAEISALKGKVPAAQWSAIDAIRSIGNIGAHMEKDVNLIVDISSDEAQKLMRLIELLLEKWYVARHDEEELLSQITGIAAEKEEMRKNHD